MLPKSHLRRNRNQFQVSDQGRDMAVESTDSSRGRRIFFASILAISGVILVAKSSGNFTSDGNVQYLRQLAADDSKDADSVDKCISPEISKVVQKLAAPFLADEANIFAFNKADTRPVMNTFFATPKGKTIKKADAETLAVWKAAWSAAGWNPRILSIKDAEVHPEYTDIDAKLKDVPLDLASEYNRACYLRHFAMAALGGGWMSDYDTIPVNMNAKVSKKDLPNDGRFTTYEGHVPSLIVGSASEWDRVSKALLREGIAAKNNMDLGVSKDGMHLFSDMYAFEALVNKEEVIAETPHSVYLAHYPSKGIRTTVMEVMRWDFRANKPLQKQCGETDDVLALHFSHSSTEDLGYSTKDRPILIAAFLDRWSKLCNGPSFYFDDNARTDVAPKAEISSENNVEVSSSVTSATNTTRTFASSMVSDK